MPAMLLPAVPAAVAGKMGAAQLLAHLAPALASIIHTAPAARATPTAGVKVLMPMAPIPVASRAAPVNTSLQLSNSGLWNRPTQNIGTTDARLAQAAQAAIAAQRAGMAASMKAILPGGSPLPATNSGKPLLRLPGIIDLAAPPIVGGVPGGASFTCADGTKTPNPTTCPEWGQGVPQVTPTIPQPNGQGVVCPGGGIASTAADCPLIGVEPQPKAAVSPYLIAGAVAVVGVGIYFAMKG